MVSWILFIVGIVALLFGIGTGIDTFRWLKEARTATGTVVELVSARLLNPMLK